MSTLKIFFLLLFCFNFITINCMLKDEELKIEIGLDQKSVIEGASYYKIYRIYSDGKIRMQTQYTYIGDFLNLDFNKDELNDAFLDNIYSKTISCGFLYIIVFYNSNNESLTYVASVNNEFEIEQKNILQILVAYSCERLDSKARLKAILAHVILEPSNDGAYQHTISFYQDKNKTKLLYKASYNFNNVSLSFIKSNYNKYIDLDDLILSNHHIFDHNSSDFGLANDYSLL